jgi:hypothetical protein
MIVLISLIFRDTVSTNKKGKSHALITEKTTRMTKKEQSRKKSVLLYNDKLSSLTSIPFSTILN